MTMNYSDYDPMPHSESWGDLESPEMVEVLTQDVLVACILLALTSLVGLLGNGLMLRALLLYPQLRIDFFLLLGSVAVGDTLSLVVAVPRHIIYLTHGPVFDAWCKASKYLDAGSGFVAAYHLVVLAVLRAILLTSRGRNPPSPRQTTVCVLLLWLTALSAAVPFLTTMEEYHGSCHYTTDTDIAKDIWLLNSFSCFVPVLLILVIYLLAHMVSKRYFQDSYSLREKRMSRLVTVLVVVFVLCQLPFRALDLHLYYKETEAALKEFPDEDAMLSLYIARNYLLCIMMADKAARPIIYSKLAPQLGEAFDEVINCTNCHRASTQGRTRAGNITNAGGNNTSGGGSARKSNNHSGRHASTSSHAPLTGGSEAGSDVPQEVKEAQDELEIVQL